MPKKRLPPRLWLRAESQRDGSQKTWVIVDGERYVRTGCAEDATAEAQQRLGEYIAAKWAPPKTGDAAKITVADVLLVYLEEKVPETASPRDNQHIVARLNDWWGEYTVADIRRKLCIDYTASRESTSSARKDLEVLRAAVNYYKEENKLDYVPVFKMPDKSQPREKYLSRSEAAALLWAALGWRRTPTGKWTRESENLPRGVYKTSTRGRTYYYAWKNGGPRLTGEPGSDEFRASYKEAYARPDAPARPEKFRNDDRRHLARLIVINMYTGSRPGVTLKLQKKQNNEGGWADLSRGVIHRKAKGEKVAHNKTKTDVKMAPRLIAHMKRWERLDRGIRWWVHYNGKPVTRINKAWRNCCRAAGLDPEEVVPHTLRHTRATWLAHAGVDRHQAAASLSMTVEQYEATYCHVDADFQKDAANAH